MFKMRSRNGSRDKERRTEVFKDLRKKAFANVQQMRHEVMIINNWLRKLGYKRAVELHSNSLRRFLMERLIIHLHACKPSIKVVS